MINMPLRLKRLFLMAVVTCVTLLFGCLPTVMAPDLITSPPNSSTVIIETFSLTPTQEIIASTTTLMAETRSITLSTPSNTANNQLLLKKTFDIYGSGYSYSPNGEIVANGFTTKVSMFDVKSGEQVAEFLKPEASLMGGGPVDFSPDGKVLAAEVKVEGADGTESEIYLLDASTLTLLNKHAYNGLLSDLKYSPDGKFLAATSSRQGLDVWNIKNKKVTHLDSLADRLAFSPVDPLLASGEVVVQGGPAVILWNTEDFRSQGIFKLEVDPKSYSSGEATSVSFSPDGRMLAAVVNGRLRFWDVLSDQEVKSSFYPSDSMIRAIYSKKGYLATLDQNGEIIVYDPATGSIIGTTSFVGDGDPQFFESRFSMTFSPDGNQLLTGGSGIPVQIWEIP
jgi:WD40 repeat protein